MRSENGITSFDALDGALCAIMAEWNRTDIDFATRVAHLSDQTSSVGFLSRLNGNYFLRVTSLVDTTTVFEDNAVDVMTGGAGLDWFFANRQGGGVFDMIDLGSNERLDDLTFVRV